MTTFEHAAAAGSAPAEDIVFDVDNVTLRFGGVTSLNAVSLQMHRGEILAVIGPNGAGKTSLFNSLTGVYTPQEGEITLSGRVGDPPVSVLGMPTHRVNHLGVARTFQNIRLFPALTALENVKVGVETRQKSGPVAAMLGMPWQRREERESTASAYALLRRVGLERRANDLASSLAYGEQRRLEIARALGTNPGVILLDEPAAGTNPVEKRELAGLIKSINVERRRQRAADRARHEAGHVGRRSDRRAELRPEDRRRLAGADSARSSRRRGLPGYVDRGGRASRPSTNPRCS